MIMMMYRIHPYFSLSMEGLMDFFKAGLNKKDDIATTPREHQAAVDATKSPQREAAAKTLSI